jgi:hypothetical protein
MLYAGPYVGHDETAQQHFLLVRPRPHISAAVAPRLPHFLQYLPITQVLPHPSPCPVSLLVLSFFATVLIGSSVCS